MERIEQERVVEEIVKQLGGRRFILMTGAHDFASLDSGVRFRLPYDRGGIDRVEVILTWDDAYRVLFKKGDETVSRHEDVYSYQLQELFTRETGLEVHL
jgi:hypothetical protein